jgi:hypothetical protein
MKAGRVGLLALWLAVGCAEIAGLGDAPNLGTPEAADASSGVDVRGGAEAATDAVSDATEGNSPDVAADHPSAPDAPHPPDVTEDVTDGGAEDTADRAEDAMDATVDKLDAPTEEGPGDSLVDAGPESCLYVHRQHPDAGTGRYTIAVGGQPVDVRCDMVLDNGGWTTFFAGHVGWQNVFAHFDSAYPLAPPQDICPDPETRCMRHVPSSVTNANQFAAMCGSDAVRFSIRASTLVYFQLGISTTWQLIDNVVPISGHPIVSDAVQIFAGDGVTNRGWILSGDNQAPLSATFASSYNATVNQWDFCNGVDYNSTEAGANTPMVYLLYR